jgi:hypothetical protein
VREQDFDPNVYDDATSEWLGVMADASDGGAVLIDADGEIVGAVDADGQPTDPAEYAFEDELDDPAAELHARLDELQERMENPPPMYDVEAIRAQAHENATNEQAKAYFDREVENMEGVLGAPAHRRRTPRGRRRLHRRDPGRRRAERLEAGRHLPRPHHARGPNRVRDAALGRPRALADRRGLRPAAAAARRGLRHLGPRGARGSGHGCARRPRHRRAALQRRDGGDGVVATLSNWESVTIPAVVNAATKASSPASRT